MDYTYKNSKSEFGGEFMKDVIAEGSYRTVQDSTVPVATVQ